MCSSALWCFTVNHYRPGTGMGRGGLWNLSFCQWESAHVFLRSSHRAKNLVQFLYCRKHFHNFKYNNFLFGMMPGIIHMYIWLSFICFAPLTENGLEEIRSRSWTRWGLELKSHTQRLQTGLGLVVWNSWTLIFSIFGVLTLRKRLTNFLWFYSLSYTGSVSRSSTTQGFSSRSYEGHNLAGFPSCQGDNECSCLLGRKEDPLNCSPQRTRLRNPAVLQMMVSLWQPAHLQMLLYPLRCTH